jgi:formylglycine-generating enzyme required for sulfatase activity
LAASGSHLAGKYAILRRSRFIARDAIPTAARIDPPHPSEIPDVDGETWINSIGMAFVRIPAGTFMMGSPDTDTEAKDWEKPAHRVTISQPFYLGKYPVTQAQWEAVMDNNPSRFKTPNHPVDSVSWDDAQAFIHKLSEREGSGDYRLPTEAQWEYACRAGTRTSRYHPDLDAIAWYQANSASQTHPVGEKLPNAWGLYDMLGNVREWCHDGKRTYSRVRVTDPMGLTEAGIERDFWGGAWGDNAQDVRAAARFWYDHVFHVDTLGFRCLSAGPR